MAVFKLILQLFFFCAKYEACLPNLELKAEKDKKYG